MREQKIDQPSQSETELLLKIYIFKEESAIFYKDSAHYRGTTRKSFTAIRLEEKHYGLSVFEAQKPVEILTPRNKKEFDTILIGEQFLAFTPL